MNSSYLSYVFELSLYYLLLIMSLPLVYAVTYHVSRIIYLLVVCIQVNG